MLVVFKPLEPTDMDFACSVYNYYVLNTTATFHTEPISVDAFTAALPMNHSLYQSYLITYGGNPCGYAYLGNWKPRQAYNRSAEVTIYLDKAFHGKGIGKQCLVFLETEAQKRGIKNLLGVITLENKASIHLFEKAGFQKVGHLKNIGEKFGRLLDVVTYQKEI
ncbi:MAG: N-acetyltransferase family protein [Salinivirgaceae bacterium]